MTARVVAAGPEEAPLLVLLHGLGATREVWGPFLDLAEERWTGRCLALDLPGHGAAPPADEYSPSAQAAVIGETIAAEAGAGPVWVLAHSLGGVIALALASGAFGMSPGRVFALGVKTVWTEPERAGLARRALAPAKVFEGRQDAIEMYLKVSGLAGLTGPDDPMAAAGVAACDGGWRLATDPRAHSVGAPDMAGLMTAARSPVFLAAGEKDPMSPLADLKVWDARAHVLPGLGHNAMVEDPAAVWTWLDEQSRAN